MLDLLRATNELYGDCSQDPRFPEIYIGGVLATDEQMEKIIAKAEETEKEWLALEYSRLRKSEYDKLNQDEMRFDDEVNGTNTWIDTIKAIKAKYPKG